MWRGYTAGWHIRIVAMGVTGYMPGGAPSTSQPKEGQVGAYPCAATASRKQRAISIILPICLTDAKLDSTMTRVLSWT